MSDSAGIGNRVARACVRACVCASALLLLACDPFSFLDEYLNPLKPTPPKESSQKNDQSLRPVQGVPAVYRADLMRVIVDGRTQLVHIAGICAPAAKQGAANDALARTHGLVALALPRQALAGIAYVQSLASNDILKLTILEWRTNSADVPYVEGDLMCGGIEPLSGRLLELGLAAVQAPVPRTAVMYDEIQMHAQEVETGMWGYACAVSRRLSVASSFDIKTLSKNKNDVFTQSEGSPHRLLESHDTVEKCGRIMLSFRAVKPMWHPYDLTLRYAFHSTIDEGRGSSHGTGGTSDSAAPNASASNAPPATVMSAMSILLASEETNVMIESPAVAYTVSTKGAVKYGMGEVLSGYDVEVWYRTNLVYAHYHHQPTEK